MQVKPGDVLIIEFTVSDPVLGDAQNADSLPIGVLSKNGIATAQVVTVANIATGLYSASVTIPANWIASDVWALRLSCDIDGATYKGIMNGTVDTKRNADLQDLTQANIRTAIGMSSANLDTQLGDIPTVAEFDARSIAAANYGTTANQTIIAGYVDELESRLTATRAAKIDNLDATISSRASATTALTNATWTDVKAGHLDSSISAVSAVLSGITNLANWLRALMRSDTANVTAKTEINLGGGTYNEADESLQGLDAGLAELAAIGAGGSFTVTVTVTSGGVAVQGVTIKIKSGSTVIDTETTNASGVATPTANAGTYTLLASYPGHYVSSSQTLVMTGDNAVAISLTAITVSAPSDPTLSTGYVHCVDEAGAAVVTAGVVEITTWMDLPPTTDGYAFSSKEVQFSNDATGLAQYTKFVRGAVYAARRGNSPKIVTFTVPDESTFAMPEMLGEL